MGLDPAKHLGKDLASLNSYLHKLKEYINTHSILLLQAIYFQRFSSSRLYFKHYSVTGLLIVILGRLYGINVCGEGGEYETLTLDCPLFVVSLYLFFSAGELLLFTAF